MRGYRLLLTAVASVAAALLLAGSGAFGYAPTAASTWVVSGGSAGGGVVNSIAVSGSTAYLGGNFSYLGPPTGSGASLDLTNGAVSPSWPAITGSVYAIVADGSNGWYVGGDFASIGPAHYDNLVHILSNGTIDTSWQARTNGPVYSLLVSGGTLYAGGSFTEANDTDRLRIAAFTASTGALIAGFSADITGNPPSTFVWAMTIFGSDLYIGGSFNQVDGQTRNSAAALDLSDGDLESWNPNITGVVFAMTQSAGEIYVGGAFALVNGTTPRNGLAAFNTGGTVDAGWNPNPLNGGSAGSVYALATSGTPASVYVGGFFTSIGGQSRQSLAKVSSTTGLADATWDPNIPGQAIYELAVSGDGASLYAGGFFQAIGPGAATSRDNVAIFSTSGSGAATAFAPIVGGPVYALAVAGTKMAVGGQFRTVGPSVVRRNNLGAIDLTTGEATSWAPYANNTVNALAISGQTVYAGGLFDRVNGNLVRKRLASYDKDTAELGDWGSDVNNGQVNVLVVAGSTVYAGGTFTEIVGASGLDEERNRLAAFEADGFGFSTSWNPNVNDEVNAIAVDGSTVYAGGSFTGVNGGTTRNHLAAFDSLTADATDFDPNVNGAVHALAVNDATVYAGGNFTAVNGGTTRWGAAAFETGGAGEFGEPSAAEAGDATAWNPRLERLTPTGSHEAGTVNGLAVAGKLVYLGGDFDFINDCSGTCLQGAAGAVDSTDGTALPTWLPEPNATVNTITLGQDGVLLGGVFTAMGYPRPGASFVANESAATLRAGFALVRGLPEPPSNVHASPGDQSATITFGPPSFTGGAAVTQYTVTVSPGGQTFNGTGSPIQVTGLTNGQSYTFQVTTTTSVGVSQPASVGPIVPTTGPTPPDQPTNVTAAPGNGQATVSFSPPASNGGSPITGYTVTSSPGGHTNSGTSSPIVVSGLTNGQSYTFTVKATNAIGTGPDSSPSNAVTPRTVPGEPTAVTATPGNGQATVGFTAPADNGGAAITGYTVVASPGGQTATGSGSGIVVGGLTNGTSYTFTVKATNAAGDGPFSSPSNAVTPSTVPGEPTGVGGTPGDSLVSVTFTPPADDGGAAISGYTVTASPGGATATGTGSPIVVDELANGTAYTFTVTATNAAGPGAASAASGPITPRTVPGAPTGTAATPGNAQATVTFGPPSSNGGAPITSYTATAFPGGQTATGAGSPLTVTGLTNGVAYTFTVKATNAAGSGPASPESNEVTPGAPVVVPGAPTGATASPGNGQAAVSFTPPADDGGSAITSYTVTSNPGGITATGPAGPITVLGLTNGVAYTFTVTATNVAGTGPASLPSNQVTPDVSFTAPGAPTNVVATPGNRSAVITFDAPASTGGTPILSYTVTASPGGLTVTGSSSPIIVTGLTNNTSYTFTVKATNGAGTGPDSSPSTPVVPEAGVRAEPPAPPAEQPRPEVPAFPPPSGPRKPPPNH
jgi:hypothetical protein